MQLVARVCVANDERSRDIVARHFDPIAQAFIDALVRVVPGLRAGQAVWCYLFAFSMRIQSQASQDRAKRLSAARGFAALPSAELVIPFVAAGIRAVAASDTTGSQLKARTMLSVASSRKTVARRSS